MFRKIYQNRKRLKILILLIYIRGIQVILKNIVSTTIIDVWGFCLACIHPASVSLLAQCWSGITPPSLTVHGLAQDCWSIPLAPGPSIPNILLGAQDPNKVKNQGSSLLHFCLIKGKEPVSFCWWLVRVELLVTDSWCGAGTLGPEGSQRKPRQDVKRVWGLIMGLEYLDPVKLPQSVQSKRLVLEQMWRERMWNKCRDTKIR